MPHDVFISFATEDRDVAEAICSALESSQIACWICTRDIVTGSSWQSSIVEAIPQSRAFVLVLSPHAIRSQHVQTEVRRAFDPHTPNRKNLPILPFQIKPVDLNNEFCYMLTGYQILDATGASLEQNLPHLVRDVKRHLATGPKAQAPPADRTVAAKPAATPTSGVQPATVVLSYKRHAQPDEQVLEYLAAEIAARGHQVFVDRHLKIGLEWPHEIERHVRQADVVIPLLSAHSIQSEMLTWEVHTAHDEAQKRGGRPRLLPVRIAFEGGLPAELGELLDRLQYFLWNGPNDNARLVRELIDAFYGPLTIKPPRPIPVGGLPLDSASYVRRPTDDAFHSGIARGDSVLLVRGARQMGKTSLLARGLERARENGSRTAFTDFQRLNRSDLESPEALYKALGAGLADELELDVYPEDVWNPRRAPNINFESFVKSLIVRDPDRSLVWALDEVDRLFTCPFGNEAFGLFRSFHNARTRGEKQAAPWKRLTMAIAYATEAHLFIADLDQSPFNVGTTIVLEDFTLDQIAELNRRYDSPLRDEAEIHQFHGLVGGQPFLVNRGLFEMAEHDVELAAFSAGAAREEGVFGDHLRRVLVALGRDPGLLDDMRGVLGGKPRLSPKSFYRLRAAGLISGESPTDARPRCPLYATFLKKNLAGK
jgi:hypothetical protein